MWSTAYMGNQTKMQNQNQQLSAILRQLDIVSMCSLGPRVTPVAAEVVQLQTADCRLQ